MVNFAATFAAHDVPMEMRVPLSADKEKFMIEGIQQHLQTMAPRLNELGKMIAESKRFAEEGAKHRAEAKFLREEGEKLLEEARQLAQNTLTKHFYSIFNKEPLAAEKIDAIFNTYLSDGSLTVEKGPNGSFSRINSMRAVTGYLTNNLHVKACDFRSFRTEVNDIPTLAEFLKTSTVKAIALKNPIPALSQAALAEAVAFRASKGDPLKVQYFA